MKDLEILENYLFNRLNEADKKLVEEKLDSDKEFEENLENLKVLKQITERHDLRSRIKEIHKKKIENYNNQEEKNNLVISYRKVWFSSAAAIFFAFISYFYWADFNSIESFSLQERSISSGLDLTEDKNTKLYINAGIAYNSKEFQKAAAGFKLVENNPENSVYIREKALWFEILAYVNYDKIKAKEVFEKYNKIENPEFEPGFSEKLKLRIKLLF